jgi:hypothetical protein
VNAKGFVLSLAAIGIMAGGVQAADQTILGNKLIAKNPSTPDKRKVIASGKEKGSPNTIVGNPTTLGGFLVVGLFGTSPSSQPFPLPQGTGSTGKAFWSALGTIGYKYSDPRGDNGPIKRVLIKKAPSGVFLIKAIGIGKNGTILTVPPNPGTSGCVALGINDSGETYSIAFTTGLVKNKGAALFSVKKPTAQGSCISGPPTTTTSSLVTTTSTSSTTSTTLYGSPSRAFLGALGSLLE